MIKGAQKRMIVVKTASSRIFEEAYFVMRGESSATENDMVSEANKIIENCGSGRREKKSKRAEVFLLPIVMFMSGSALGGGLVFAIMALCAG